VYSACPCSPFIKKLLKTLEALQQPGGTAFVPQQENGRQSKALPSSGSARSSCWQRAGLLPTWPAAAVWRHDGPAGAGITRQLLRPFSVLTQRAKHGYCQKNPQQTTKTT